MNLQASAKRTLTLIAVALVVVLIAFTTVMVVLIRGSDSEPARITAYTHGTTSEVAPYVYCGIYLDECVGDEESTFLDVPPGMPLQLSLPSEISDAPWLLIAAYMAPDGTGIAAPSSYAAGEAAAVTVPSSEEFPLIGVEIRLPSAVIDENENPQARAVWSVATASDVATDQ
ncbi:DUF2771 domain-containing protein [Rhodococcus rhodnii]|uniref:DUF2771 domain-containing protein n=2 Tax=Rhodococcus rhodnii TaxID=38312 RepID=R7WRF2_9NOCA|nr:DUF2771 domain-containing protein [Rhodococcus rhodnii]EOM77855.1 hypothetical protein Rrhod_0748 [Rhodococcus rhodnii LMG 5362]TXG88968.1 DUF2771 domain-containing protein [Rhodococcus rhodnii]